MTNNRQTLFTPFINQLPDVAFKRHAPTLSLLDTQEFLMISGADASKFLQGQLTNDLNTLKPQQHHLSAGCTPKGRMYSAFRMLDTGSGYLLAMHEGLLEHTKTTLDKYAVFFKTDIAEQETLVSLGLSGNDIDTTIEALFGGLPENSAALPVVDNGWLLKVSGTCSRYELWLPATQLQQWWDKLTPTFTPASQQHWQLLDIDIVQPQLPPEAIEQYIPQHLNLPTLNAVSFRKGCYTGQEIVARMQNLGQLKSRTYHLTANAIVDLPTGTKLSNSAGKNIGEVLYAVNMEKENITELLAVIRTESVEAHDIHLSESNVIITAHPLPYTIDVKAELLR